MRRISISLVLVIISVLYCFSQGDNEIQVYASPTVGNKATIFELHSNYTFKGSKYLSNSELAHWTNESLEVTHGFADNVEVGFYLFTGLSPDRDYQFLGAQIRPRITAPEVWDLPVGLSISTEFGFFRPDKDSEYFWQGEIRPIIDKSIGNVYLAFNPNIGFAFDNGNSEWDIAPQFKAVYTILEKFGLGFEYYSNLGTFSDILPGNYQEHLLGPMFDLYVHPDWELNAGFLFGLTDNSNQDIFKIIIGRRIGGN